MWPLKKRYPALGEIKSIKDGWLVLKGKFDGDPIMIRKNATVKQWVGHPQLPVKLAFAMPANTPMPGALLTAEEALVLGEVEDIIVAKVEAECVGLHVLTLTTGMMREIVFYIAEGYDIQKLHVEVEKSVKSHEVQCIAEIERKWESYISVTNNRDTEFVSKTLLARGFPS